MLTHKQTGISALFFLVMSLFVVIAMCSTAIDTQWVEDVLPTLAIGVGVPISIFIFWVMISVIQGKAWALQFYLGVLLFMIDALLRRRSPLEVGIDWYSTLKFSLVLGAFFMGIAHLKKSSTLLLRPPMVWMLLYALWAIFSVTYSIIPIYTFAASFMFLSFVLFSVAVSQILSMKQLLMAMIISWSVFLIFSWGAYYFQPELGRISSWSTNGNIDRFAGIAGQPNIMGRLLALMIIVLATLQIHRFIRPQLSVVLFLAIISTFLMTQSRTAAVCAIFPMGIIFIRRHPVLILSSLTMSIILIVLLESILTSIDTTVFSRSGDFNELLTLSGRTDIWAFCWEKIKNEPWFGYGYASSRLLISQGWSSKYGFTTQSSHNMWLQSLLSVGLIGTLPLIIAIVNQVVMFFKQPNQLRDMTLLFVLIIGVMEAGAIGSTPNLLTFFWLITISKAMTYEKKTST